MPNLCTVKRELYLPAPGPKSAPYVTRTYLGPGLRLRETRFFEYASDLFNSIQQRFSEDNGRTWSAWEMVELEKPVQGDCTEEELTTGVGFDPVSGQVLRLVYQCIFLGDPTRAMVRSWGTGLIFAFDHGFYELSADLGRTWSPQRQLTYEPGPGFSPEDWGQPGYLRHNLMGVGYNVLAASSGALAFAATVPVPYCTPADELDLPEVPMMGHVSGVRVFVGRWNAQAADYDWLVSEPVFLPRQVSTRGLLEPAIAELTSGRMLLIMRGSNAGPDLEQRPGRVWKSLSEDGGHTWSPVEELRYDTGEQFYSPSSMSLLLRHSVTGKLYWIGNISPDPVHGNEPRYPLVIAEVDEDLVALRKDTVTVLDDRDSARDAESLALSNFSLLENRETHEIELYMTRLGAQGGGDQVFESDAYKYTLTLR